MADVFIGCEYSGAMRDAFRRAGHNAWSCDLPDVEPEGEFKNYHFYGDAIDIAHAYAPAGEWDLVIMHPPCKFLCNSGVRWLWKPDGTRDAERFANMELARRFFMECWKLKHIAKRVAVENSIPHGLAGLPQYTQINHPWWHGVPMFKPYVWWLYNLPPIVATNKLTPPKPGTDEHKSWSKVHRMSPGKDRGKERARTLPEVAAVHAAQWGVLL